MSEYCPKCGDKTSEDDSRLCAKCQAASSFAAPTGLDASDRIHTTIKTATPKTDAAWDALERRACGTAYVKLQMQKLEQENARLIRLVETIRDKAELRYGGEKNLMAFAKLKDMAAASNAALSGVERKP